MRRIFLAMFFILISMFVYGEEIMELKDYPLLFKEFNSSFGFTKGITQSGDGKYVAVTGGDTVEIFEVSSGILIKELKNEGNGIETIEFSPDGKYLASGDRDKTIKIWEVSSGNCINSLSGHEGLVYSVVYSPDGKYIASGSMDDTIKIWEASSGKCIKTLKGHNSSVNFISYSPDGKYIASGSMDDTIKIWEAFMKIGRAHV